jgi:hypothetical protein
VGPNASKVKPAPDAICVCGQPFSYHEEADLYPFIDATTGEKFFRPEPEPVGRNVSLPEDERREDYAMADGLLDYFPNALAEVAAHSKRAMKQHGLTEFKWHRGKSTDHRNKIVRHVIDAGKFDDRGNRHSTALVWRALALLQEELERDEGYPLPRGAVE